MPYAILAIDQGTTSTRALVFGADQSLLGMAQEELPQIYPQPGWVEHDPEAICRAVVSTARGAIARAGLGAADIAGIGITNQRETAVVWDRRTGEVLHSAIVWQDRRGTAFCDKTVDSFLIWRLTGGRQHLTDATNASRTMLLDLDSGDWADGMLSLFGIPRAMLPEVADCAAWIYV